MIIKLLKKDLKLELKSSHFILFIYLIFILSFLATFSVQLGIFKEADKIKLVPILNFLIFCFCSNFIFYKAFDADYNKMAIINLKLSGYSELKIIISKILISYTSLIIGNLACLLIICGFLNTLHLISFTYILILGLTTLVYTINGVVFSALFQTISSKGILVPIVNLPISLPIIISGISLCYSAIFNEQILGNNWLNLLWITLVLYSFITIKTSSFIFNYEKN